MGSSPQYRADLAETALPEILFTIYRHRVPGMVEASQDEVSKRIYVQEGEVTWATSSDRNDSLGAHLRRTGRLTVEDFRKVMELRNESNKRLGELLVEGGLLSPAEIYHAVRDQVEAVVWSLFSWSRGEITFEIGEVGDRRMIRIGLPMRQMILKGIQHTPAAGAKALVARLGGKNRRFEPCYQLADLIEVALDRDQTRLLQIVGSERTLYEVCSAGPGSTLENAKLMYGFWILGLVRPVDDPRDDGEGSDPPSRIKIKFRTGAGRTVES